jgi:hypothetical protein
MRNSVSCPDKKRTVSSKDVTDRIDIVDLERVSRVILSVSPCRSGTTILLRVFGAAGIESHFQQLKNVLRWQLQGADVTWQVPQRPDETVFLKETLGPYTEAEARFNPLEVLLGAGFPPQKLKVFIVGRAPLSTWASWDAWWRGKTSVDKFILAYKTTEQVRRQAHQQGIPVTTFVYEALGNNGSETIVKNVFERLGVPYSPPIAVKGWNKLPPFGAPGSNIVLPDEPPQFITLNIHKRVEKSDKLVYLSRDKSIPDLREDDVSQIIEAGLPEIYEGWRKACEQSLHVEVAKNRDWELYFGGKPDSGETGS